MRTIGALYFVGLLATAGLGCAKKGVTTDVEQARTALRAQLMEAAEAVAPGAEIKVIVDRAPTPCQSDLAGQDLKSESSSLDLLVVVPKGTEMAALEQVVTMWERAGVDLRRVKIPEPRGD